MEEQLFRLQFQMSMGQMDGLKKVRAMRKDRARIHYPARAGTGGSGRRNKMAEQQQASVKNEKIGQVVSTKMTKTIVVEVSRRVPHPLYRRIIGKRKKFYAHDEEGRAKMGDVVRIIECRPLSKLKRWRLAEVVRRAAQVGVQPSDLDVKV
jgi:small subunit ribosomal protein S17